MGGKQPRTPDGTPLEETGFGYTHALIGGKYRTIILFWLYSRPPAMRFNELQRALGSISFRTLSAALKGLERDGLIHREEFPQIPPRVEYRLTPRGESLIPVLQSMCAWGMENRPAPARAVKTTTAHAVQPTTTHAVDTTTAPTVQPGTTQALIHRIRK